VLRTQRSHRFLSRSFIAGVTVALLLASTAGGEAKSRATGERAPQPTPLATPTPAPSPSPTSIPTPAPVSFDLRTVADRALKLASAPFQDPSGQVPEFLLRIGYDQWRKIRFRKDHGLWNEEGSPFEVQFFHPGLLYNRTVKIGLVDADGIRDFPFSTDMFEYGDNDFADKVAHATLNFSGFRVHAPINRRTYRDEVVAFLGASYFRAVSAGLQYGLSARGLALDTGLPSGEEFPYFREYWLLTPRPEDTAFTFFALLDSPGCTGAYKFVVTPGKRTVMDIDGVLFRRKDIAKVGLAPLTSMFFYGESLNGMPGDYRPEVHDSDVLLMKTQEGEWLWRPIENPRRLTITPFPMTHPAGFGLLQADTDFDHYQDLEARYELRPSVWIEPKGPWGQGRVELIEIPTDSEINDNIVSFWVPANPVSMDAEGKTVEIKRPLLAPEPFSYRMTWFAPDESFIPLGIPVATRTIRLKDESMRRFVIDFEGETLAELPADAGLTSVVTIGDGAKLTEKQLQKNEATGGWRLFLQVQIDADRLKGVLPTSKPAIRLKALLKKGENLPDPLTVTWVYDLQP
jgi:glucans biosynthesis protein